MMAKFPTISAESAHGAEIIANTWGGEVTITAEAAPATPPDVPPNLTAKLPRFDLAAYNGGPMRLSGFQHPLIIDASGVKFATESMPIYVGHPADDAPASEMMEALVGQGQCSVVGGKITATGNVTGSSKTVRLMLDHAAKGFKFQNSVHGRPTEMSFIKAGETATVNGQSVTGPANVARQSVLDHIAILPLGADTSTSAHIAASHAAGEINMEKFAWIKANYGLDEAGFNALPEAGRNTISAAFDADKEPKKELEKKTTEITATGGATNTESLIKAQNAAVAANQNRIAAIGAIDGARDYPNITAQAVSENWTAEKAENAIIKAQRDALTQNSLRPGKGVNAELRANLPKVLAAATLLSCGYRGDLTQDRNYGETVMNMTDTLYRNEGSRVITPSKLARIVARANGVNDLPDGHGDDFWSEALSNDRICPRGGERMIRAEFSSISLPVALSNVMNKFVLDAYMAVDPNHADPSSKSQAWKQFTRVSSVQDFKPHFRFRLVANLLLQRLLNGGEIQHGTVGEQSYMLTADTKAIQLGLTRKDLINDDQSVLSTMPTHFGLGAGQTVANDIYACLLLGKQSDGATDFFTASDITTAGALMKANLTGTAALSFTTLEASRTRFANQTQPNGQPAGLLPEILLLPPGLVGTGQNLYKSSEVRDTTASTKFGTTNILSGMYRPVSSSYLANGAINSLTGSIVAGSATSWYLSALATAFAYPLEIGFLNGVEAPVVERAEADFNRLGISFRTFIDYGVSMSEPRSMQKQTA